jgi:outer membrane protein TolC
MTFTKGTLSSIILGLLFSLFNSGIAFAQKTNYNNIVLPQDSITDLLEEKLIQVAWANYPKNEVLRSKVAENIEKVRLAKLQPLQNINLSMQFNALSNSSSSATTTTVGGATTSVPNTATGVPKVGFGLGFGIGSLFLVPTQVRMARQVVKQSEEELKQQKLAVRSEVIKRYAEYKSQVDIMQYLLESQEQARTNLVIMQRMFETNEATIEEYQTSLKFYNEAREKSITTQYKIKIAKANLEEILTVKLEEIK